MRIAIIGSRGGMGSFFARYFLSKGHQVKGFDIRKQNRFIPEVEISDSIQEAVQDADAAVIATPISTTVDVCKKVVNGMRPKTYLIEISSVKGHIVPHLRRLVSRKTIKLISIHPLFGPLQDVDKKIRMVLLNTKKTIEDDARLFFPDAELFIMDLISHDRIMGIILSLTHATNTAFLSSVGLDTKPEKLKKMAPPIAFLQLSLAQAVLTQDPELMSIIQIDNEYSERLIRHMALELNRIANLIRSGDTIRLKRFFANKVKRFGSDDALYDIYKAYYSVVN